MTRSQQLDHYKEQRKKIFETQKLKRQQMEEEAKKKHSKDHGRTRPH